MQPKIDCAHDEMVDVTRLQPNPRNPNKHPAKQIDMLAKIIAYQGQRAPIVVSKRSGFIVKGHGRLEAIKSLAWAKAAVDYQDYEDEAQEFADMVADNKIAELAEHDDEMMKLGALDLQLDVNGFDLDLLGIPDLDLSVPDADKDAIEDDVPEVTRSISKLGDLYEMGEHRLLCGDSTDLKSVELLMNGGKAELCFTSPPYADQREYNGGKELSTEHLAKFIKPSAANYFAVNLGYSRKNGEVNPYWEDYIKEAKSGGLKFLSWNIWDKGECGSIGNQTAMFAIQHEWIFVFGPAQKDLNLTVPNKNTDKLRHGSIRMADGSLKPVTNTDAKVREFSQLKTILVQTPQKARNHGIDHPAMFPVEFPEHYINAMTAKQDYVYEPFGGSGTTLIACEKTKRRCFIMELDPKYADVIVSRYVKYTGKSSIKRNGEPMEWTI